MFEKHKYFLLFISTENSRFELYKVIIFLLLTVYIEKNPQSTEQEIKKVELITVFYGVLM